MALNWFVLRIDSHINGMVSLTLKYNFLFRNTISTSPFIRTGRIQKYIYIYINDGNQQMPDLYIFS